MNVWYILLTAQRQSVSPWHIDITKITSGGRAFPSPPTDWPFRLRFPQLDSNRGLLILGGEQTSVGVSTLRD